MTCMFGRQETGTGRRGWMVGPDPVGMGNVYMVGEPIYYADGVRSPAWDWFDDTMDHRAELVPGTPLNAYYGRSPAWDLDGD